MSDDRLTNLVLALAAVVAFIVIVAFLVGFGFEAVKWLGHTQK